MRKKTTKKRTTKAAAVKEETVTAAKDTTKEAAPVKETVTKVEAVTEAEVCFIDVRVFEKILNENRNFSNEIIIELCQNELESFRRCANRTQKLIRGNMADAILEFADKIFMSDSFTLPISQSELANLVDTSRESVSRVLTEFDKDGIIRLSGKKVEIINKKSLLMIRFLS